MKRYGYILKAFSWLGETEVEEKTELETQKQAANQPCVSLWARNMLRDTARPAGHSVRYRAQTSLQQAAMDAAHPTRETPASPGTGTTPDRKPNLPRS
jgi:hypothetical protein